MARIDPERERRRLAHFYAGQLDGELEKIAGQAYELTELAKEVLRSELARRGLSPEFLEQRAEPLITEPQLGDPPRPSDPQKSESPIDYLTPEEDGELELRRRVTVRRFRDLPEALLAKTCLESAGLDSVLVDDNLVRLDWFWSNLISGVKLMVDPDELDSANEILNQPIPQKFEVAGIGEFEQPHCPKCQSLDVTFQELNRPVSYLTLWINFPVPVYRRGWRCHSCDVEWEDDGLPAPNDSLA